MARTSTASPPEGSDEWGVRPDKGYELKLDDRELVALMRDRRDRDVLHPHVAKAGASDPKDAKADRPSPPAKPEAKPAKPAAKPAATPKPNSEPGKPAVKAASRPRPASRLSTAAPSGGRLPHGRIRPRPGQVILLTLETTCDETAAAIVTDRLEVVGSVVASQDDLHRRFGGVVPELASAPRRADPTRHRRGLTRAGRSLADLDAVAVANTPGLAGSLLVGLVAAKTLAAALDIPLVAVNHLQAHIYACRLAGGEEVFPAWA